MKLTRILASTAVVTGAAIGSFSLSAALDDANGPSELEGEPALIAVTEEPTLIEPTSGLEPAKFDYRVSSALGSGTDVAHLIDVTDEQTCIHIELGEGYAEDCYLAETIAAGTAWGAFGQPDGSAIMVGVVPDAVNRVSLGGNDVQLNGNVWSTTVSSSDPIDLRVENSVTGEVAALEPAK